MAMRPAPGRRGSRYFNGADLAYVALLLRRHEQGGCEDPDCPADRLAAFLEHLERELIGAGRPARAQLWASLFLLPPIDRAPQLERRIPDAPARQ